MYKTALKTVLISAMSCCGLVSQAAPSNTILGGIELDVTPMSSYVQKMKATCPGIQVNVPVAMIPAACYKLPGNLIILMSDPNDQEQRIAAASILYEKDFHSTLFNKYLSSLKKKYGNPVSSRIPFVGDKNVRWEHKDIVILLEEPHLEPNGNVTYLTKRMEELTNKTLKEKGLAEKDNLDSML